MLDLSRCQNLLEVGFGQTLEEDIGDRLRPFDRASPAGLVGTIPGWCAGLAIRPPVEWCQPSFMLVSLGVPTAPEDDSEYQWDDENVLAIQIEREQPFTPESSRRDRALDRQMLERRRGETRHCAVQLSPRLAPTLKLFPPGRHLLPDPDELAASNFIASWPSNVRTLTRCGPSRAWLDLERQLLTNVGLKEC